MANTKSAKKRVKQNEKRRLVNLSRRSAVKTATKKVLEAVQADDIATAKELFRKAESQVARACGKGILKKNTAARKISGLSRIIAKAEGSGK